MNKPYIFNGHEITEDFLDKLAEVLAEPPSQGDVSWLEYMIKNGWTVEAMLKDYASIKEADLEKSTITVPSKKPDQSGKRKWWKNGPKI